MIDVLTRAYLEPHRFYHSLEHINFMFAKAKEWKWELTEELIYAIWFHDAIYQPGAKDNEEKSAELFWAWKYTITKKENWGENKPQYEIIRQMILDTKTHIPTIEESKRLIDLDLAILAEEFNIKITKYFTSYKKIYSLQKGDENYLYSRYLENIRKEYSQAFEEKMEKLVRAYHSSEPVNRQIYLYLDMSIENYNRWVENPQKYFDSIWAKGRSKWINSMLKREQIFYTEEGKKLETQARRNLEMELKLYE